jgi:hypothetical protein
MSENNNRLRFAPTRWEDLGTSSSSQAGTASASQQNRSQRTSNPQWQAELRKSEAEIQALSKRLRAGEFTGRGANAAAEALKFMEMRREDILAKINSGREIKTTAGDVGREIVNAPTRGAVSTVLGGVAGVADYLGFDDSAESVREYRDDFNKKYAAPEAATQNAMLRYGGMGGEALGSTVPYLAGGIASVPVRAAVGAMSFGGGVDQQDERVKQAREQGLTVSSGQEILAETFGGAVGLSELLPVKGLLSRVPNGYGQKVVEMVGQRFATTAVGRAMAQGGKRAVGKIAGSAIEEGVQEAAAGVAQDLIELGVYNPNVEVGQSALQDFALGGFAGGVLRGGTEVARRFIKEDPNSEIDPSQRGTEDNELLDALTARDQTAGQTTLRLEGPSAPDLSGMDNISAGGMSYTPTQILEFATNNQSNPRIADIMSQPVSDATKVQQVARILNQEEAARVEPEAVRRISGMIGGNTPVSRSRQMITEELSKIDPAIVAESPALSSIAKAVETGGTGKQFVNGLRNIVSNYTPPAQQGETFFARPYMKTQETADGNREVVADGSVIMNPSQASDEAQRLRETDQSFRMADVRQTRFDTATGAGTQREDLRAGAPDPTPQFFLNPEYYGEDLGGIAATIVGAEGGKVSIQYEQQAQDGSVQTVSEQVDPSTLFARLVRETPRLSQDLAGDLRKPKAGVGTSMNPRRSVDRTQSRSVVPFQEDAPAPPEQQAPLRQAEALPAPEPVEAASTPEVTAPPAQRQLPAPIRRTPPKVEEAQQQDAEEEVDIDNDPRMIELNERFDAALERVQETENTREARKLAKTLIKEGVIDEDAYVDIDEAIKDETDRDFKHDTAMAAIEDAIESQRDNAAADLESEIYSEIDGDNTRYSGRTSKRKKRTYATGASATTEQVDTKAEPQAETQAEPTAEERPIRPENTNNNIDDVGRGVTKASDIVARNPTPRKDQAAKGKEKKIDHEAVIEDRLNKIASRGRQGRIIANRLRSIMKQGGYTPKQFYYAFAAGDVMSRVLPKNASVDILFVPSLKATNANAAAASGIELGAENTGKYEIYDVSQNGMSGLITLSLSEDLGAYTRESAAHEAFHVIQDMLEVYDPQAFDMLNNVFEDGMTVDQFDASILRVLKATDMGNGVSFYDDLVANFGDKPLAFYEAQAVAFGALVNAKETGSPMRGLKATIARIVDMIERFRREFGNLLRNDNVMSLADYFEGYRSGETQEYLNDVTAPTKLAKALVGAEGFERYSGRQKPTYEHPSIGKQKINPPIDATSTIPFLYDNGNTKALQVPDERMGLKDTVQFIQNRTRKALMNRFGVDRITGPSPKTDKYLKDSIAAEAEAAILKEMATGKRSALDWYTKAIEDAIKEASRIYPMLRDDDIAKRLSNSRGINSKEDARVMFTLALSITSQNMKVRDNARATTEQFDTFIETGRFDPSKKYGTKAPSITNNLALANYMLEKVFDGKVGELGQFLNTEFTVAELNALGRKVQAKDGLDKPPFKISGELASEMVYGSAIFGPKIGNGFYQNLNRNFSPVTIDLWFMRLWGRLTGTLVGNDTAIDKQITSLREAVEADAHPSTKVPDGYAERFNEATDAEVVGLGIQLAAEWERQYKALQKQGMSSDEITEKGLKPDWAFKAVALAGQLKPNDAPTNGAQRKWIRDVVAGSVKMLAQKGYNVTPADLQALVWYPEKDLVNLFKEGKLEANLNVSYDTAFAELAAVRNTNATSANTDAGNRRSDGAPRQGDGGRGAGQAAVAGDQALAAGAVEEEGDQVRRTLPADVRNRLIERGTRYSGRTGRRDGGAGNRGGEIAPLEGAPKVRGGGPNADLVKVAEDYALENGIPLTRQSEYVAIDEAFSRRVAQAYEEMEDAPNDPAVIEAYEDLIRQTRKQYDALVEAGYEFTFFGNDFDPYGTNPWEAMRDLRNNKRMAVYSTVEGYGSDGSALRASTNPLLADTGLKWRDQSGVMRPVLANDLFRAVHDAFGHGLEGAGFRSRGEENAWQAHARLFTGPALAALTSETRGQNSWLNFGPYGEANRTAGLFETVFAPQKIGLMPEWTWTERVVDGEQTPSSRAVYTPERTEQILKDYTYPFDDKKSKGWMTFMSPDQFLGLTLSKDGRDRLATMDPTKTRARELNVDELRQVSQPLFLEIADPYMASGKEQPRRVMGHEGRHRMTAFKAAGIDQIPVILIRQNGAAQIEDLTGVQLAPQRAGRSDPFSNGDTETVIDEAVPISNENADRIREMMDGEGVRFSGRRARNTGGVSESMLDKVVARSNKKSFFSTFLDNLVGRQGNESRRRALVRNVVNDKDGTLILDKFLDAALRGVDPADGRVPTDGSSVGRMMEMVSQSSGVIQAALEYGPPVYDGELTTINENIKGLIEIFEPIGEANSEAFQTYAVSRRESQLRREGRVGFPELTDAEIAETLRNADAVFGQVFDEYQEFNRAILDYAVDTGLMTSDFGEKLKSMDYIPYYRAFEQDDGDLEVLGPKVQAAINNPKSGLDLKLKGSDNNIGNLYENVVKNLQSILVASRKNLALQEAADVVDALNELGIDDVGKRVPTPEGKGIMRLRVEGKPVYYKIEDPAVWVAIAALGPQQMGVWMKAMSSIAGVFRAGITMTTSFILANMYRGKISTFVTTDTKLSGPIATFKGMRDALRGDEATRMIKVNTGMGGYDYGMGDKNYADEIRRRYRRGEGGHGITRDILDRFKGAYVMMERLGEASEFAERVVLYNSVLEKTGSEKTAAYEAMNLTNFGRKGAGQGYIGEAVRSLVPIIPFLNARIQGLYRIAENQTNEATIMGLRKKVVFRGLLYSAFATAVYALFQDDERWENETPENKMLNDILYIGDVRVVLPRPFEVGTIFGSFPVAMYDYIKDRDGAQLSKKVQFAFLNTFALNPIPQAVKPTTEVAFNYDTFRGMPINDMGDMNLPAAMRYDERTTETAKAVGGALGVSPKNVDHLVRGHLGSMGAGMLAGIDTVLAGMGAIPKEADGLFGDPYHIGDLLASASGVERFFKDADSAPSRFVGEFYEVKREADQTNRAYKKLLAEQREEEAAEYLEEMKAPMSARKQLGKIGRQISEINKQRDAILTDPKMTPSQKKLKLKTLDAERKKLAKQGYMYAKGFKAAPTYYTEEEESEE